MESSAESMVEICRFGVTFLAISKTVKSHPETGMTLRLWSYDGQEQ